MLSQKTTLFYLAVVFATFELGYTCTSTIVPGPTGTALQRKMGRTVREVGKPPDKPDGKQVTSVSELSCSSSNRQNCCWRQNRDSTIDWVTALGKASKPLVKRHFGQSTIPSGIGFLAAYANDARPGEEAALESCVIPCTQGPINLQLESWQSDSTRLKACVTPADFYSPSNCQFFTKDTGSVSIQPIPEPHRIVIVGENFVAPDGSVVAVDNLNVNAQISQDVFCNGQPTTDPPIITTTQGTGGGGGGVELCRKTTCGFESGSGCQYNLGGGNWRIAQGLTGNRNTGVGKAAPGSEPYYAVARLNPGQKMIMESQPLNVNEPFELKFQAFERTKDMVLKACINDEFNCPWQSNPSVDIADRRWQQASIPVGPGVNKVLFVAENTGQQYGAAGVDDIKLFTNTGAPVNC